MRSQPLSCFAFDGGREAEARLVAEFAGGRTILRVQRAAYPFHVTRGFYLDRARPDVLTLYMQSASGGLYAGDRVTIDVAVGADAALHLTSQSATVVHGGRPVPAAQSVRVNVGKGGFCAISGDPYVLFPGADLVLDTIAVVDEDAALVIADGIAVHDPRGSSRMFARYAGRLRMTRPDGRVLLKDCGRIAGAEMRSGAFAEMNAAATAFVIAPTDRLPPSDALMEAVNECGCLAGTSEVPNRAGLVVRMLGPDGGALGRGIEAVFHVATGAALGMEPARRRK